MNHRQGKRINVDIPVVANVPEHEPIAGHLQNLSLSGACIRFDRPPYTDDKKTVEFTLYLQAEEGCDPVRLRTQGYVAWKRDHHIGVIFMSEKTWLVQWLSEMDADFQSAA